MRRFAFVIVAVVTALGGAPSAVSGAHSADDPGVVDDTTVAAVAAAAAILGLTLVAVSAVRGRGRRRAAAARSLTGAGDPELRAAIERRVLRRAHLRRAPEPDELGEDAGAERS